MIFSAAVYVTTKRKLKITRVNQKKKKKKKTRGESMQVNSMVWFTKMKPGNEISININDSQTSMECHSSIKYLVCMT